MRLKEIDYLRGYAIMLVLVRHMELSLPALHNDAAQLFGITDFETGVDVFFAISGFVIAGALAPLWPTTGDLSARFAYCLVFFQKRFVRLWPAAAVWLLYNFVAAIVFAQANIWPAPHDALKKLILGLVYLYNFQEYTNSTALGYFWSLSVEWQFYLLFPLLLVLIRADAWRVGVLLGLVLVLALWQFGGDNWWMFRCDGLIFGTLAYILLRRVGVALPCYRWLEKPAGSAAFTAVLLLAILASPADIQPYRLGMVFAAALATILVAAASANQGYISTFGLPRLVGWFGSRSYSIYLVHLPCILTFQSINALYFHMGLLHAVIRHGVTLVWSVSILLMVGGAAELTYRLVELPSHRASRAIPPAARAQGDVVGDYRKPSIPALQNVQGISRDHI